MAEIVLFHHVQGKTSGVTDLAAALEAAGHTVHVPDLLDGHTFASIEEGVAFVEELGFGAIIERGEAAAAAVPADVVYIGISLGVLPAQKLAQSREGARGAVFFASCVPTSEFGDGWPPGVPVLIHGMDNDPFFAGEGDIDAARALVAEVGADGDAELIVYPGDGHLFIDSSVEAYDADAAAEALSRTLDFLARI